MGDESELHLEATAPGDLIAAAIRRVAHLYREDQVTLVSDVDPTAPSVLVDRERFAVVFSCLLRNARAHTLPGGSVMIRAEPDGARVRFSVSDTGGGIPAAYLEQIFEPFFQVPGTEDLGDVGAGLAVARRIVQAHGGEIQCASAEGRGTTVWFTLPAMV